MVLTLTPCACGCGELTPVSAKTDRAHGYERGVPRRYVPYHHGRKYQNDADRKQAHNAQARGYVERHPDRKAASRRTHLAKPDAWAKHLAAGRRQHARNPEKTNAQTAAWRARHPDQWRNIVRRRAERRANAVGANPVLDDLYANILRGDPCAYCGSAGDAIDHVVPLAAGGAGDWHNLTAACRSCNSSKHASPLFPWLAIVGPRVDAAPRA
jgi:5-methylcytosine-specific restriction endonuclease McrA